MAVAPLHVARVEDLEAPPFSQLLSRVRSAVSSGSDTIVDAYMDDDRIVVRGPKYESLIVEIDKLPSLRPMSKDEVANFEVDPDGSFLYWPAHDIHLGWSQFLQASKPMDLLKAKQRQSTFNIRYGESIRRVRMAHGIKQTEVVGLTDRQISRIEHGSRATHKALASLAAAHGLGLNAYLSELADD